MPAVIEQFRIKPPDSKPIGVDHENGIINGVVVVEAGDVASHHVSFDDESLKQVVALGNATNGVKVRFAHPGMLEDAIGSYLGVLTGFRQDGGKVRADLKVADVANKSPKGPLKDYTLELAATAPEHFGMSMVVALERVDEEDAKYPRGRIHSLEAVDVVDSPAATESLLSKERGPTVADTKEIESLKTKLAEATAAREAAEARERAAATATSSVTEETLSREEVIRITKEAQVEAMRAENERCAKIRQYCKKFGVAEEFAEDLIVGGESFDAAAPKILDKLAEKQGEMKAVTFGGTFEPIAAERDKFSATVSTAMTYRALSNSGLSADAIERHLPQNNRPQGWEDYRNAMPIDIARETLQMFGFNIRGASKESIARAAMGDRHALMFSGDYGFHTTGSFSYIMMDVINKSMRAAYQERQMTWQSVFRTAESVPDFKNIHRIQMSESPNLNLWLDNKPMNQVSFTDEKETYAVEAYGQEASFSWRTLVNDDLNAFSRVPANMGSAAARTINTLMWSIITSNPTMSDGQALFLETPAGNRKKTNFLNSGGGTVSVASLGVGRKVMRQQVGSNDAEGNASEAILNLMARHLVVPAALETVAEQVVTSIADISKSNDITYNPFRGLNLVVEPLLDSDSATAWYLFAGTDQIDTVELTFLAGQEMPVTNSWEDPKTWAVIYQIAQSYGAAPIDFRGMYKNDGTA